MMQTLRPGAQDAFKIPSLVDGKQVPYVPPKPMGCMPVQPVGYAK
jgi:hypothetical protein